MIKTIPRLRKEILFLRVLSTPRSKIKLPAAVTLPVIVTKIPVVHRLEMKWTNLVIPGMK